MSHAWPLPLWSIVESNSLPKHSPLLDPGQAVLPPEVNAFLKRIPTLKANAQTRSLALRNKQLVRE